MDQVFHTHGRGFFYKKGNNAITSFVRADLLIFNEMRVPSGPTPT